MERYDSAINTGEPHLQWSNLICRVNGKAAIITIAICVTSLSAIWADQWAVDHSNKRTVSSQQSNSHE
jgi:hypothetical protein